MLNNITKEIREAIESNLPAATAGVMSDFITEAENTKDELVLIQKINKKQTSEIEEQKIIISQLSALKYQKKDLEKKEATLRIRERDLNLEIVQIKLEAANARNEKIESLVEKVFGHPAVSVSTNKSIPTMTDPATGQTPYQNGCVNEHEDKIIVENKE
jgi:hypothetical protein